MPISRATDGTDVDANESFIEFFGRRHEEVIGNTAAGIVYDTSLERLFRRRQRLKNSLHLKA